MVLSALAVLAGVALGFAGSRALRRPSRSGAAASVARNVGGALGRRRGLSPPELQRACFSEMIRRAEVWPDGATVVPSHFVVRLHPDDVATVDEGRRWFVGGLVDAVRQAAADNGWRLTGDPAVDIEADPSRRPGAPAVDATLPAPPPRPRRERPTSPPPALPPPAALIRTDTDARLPLRADAVTIGRAGDRAIRIDDSRVSRHHAIVRRDRRGWLVADDGSSNGTRVGGQELAEGERRLLQDGDLIEVGPIGIRYVEEPDRRIDEPGSRPLDDATRTRVSAEVLGPSEPDRRTGR